MGLAPTGGSHGNPHPTAGIANCARQRGGVAAGGTRTAVGSAGGGVSAYAVAEPLTFQTDAFRDGLIEFWLSKAVMLRSNLVGREVNTTDYQRYVADLVRQQVVVIATGGGAVSARAAKAATSTIPIVFITGGDPVKLGLVASLNRPGSNMTGISPFISVLGAKRLELLHAVLFNPKSPEAETVASNAQTAARSVGQHIIVLTAAAEDDFDRAFENHGPTTRRCASGRHGPILYQSSRAPSRVGGTPRHPCNL